jgi:predicted dehydrogenase
MKVAIAGIGKRAAAVLSGLKSEMPEVDFVGYYDPAPVGLDQIGADMPGFASLDDLLAGTRPDLLFVGSPNKYHLEQIETGLAAGVRIFTEKPVVTTMEQTWALVELLAKYGENRVMVGLVLRYSQHMVDLRAALDAGHLGQIASMEANEHIGPYHGAFFMRDWRRDTEESGGFMLEKCCHDLDIYNMITGSRPKRVASFGGRRSFVPEFAPGETSPDDVYHIKKSDWNGIDDPFRSTGDIIDCQTAILEYESGASLAFHTNLNVPDEHRRFCVIGSHGMAEGDFVRGFLSVTDARSGDRLVDLDYSGDDNPDEGHYGADGMMVRDVADYLRGTTTQLPVSVVDALEAGIAALALDQARASGQVVDLTETWARFDAYNLRGV